MLYVQNTIKIYKKMQATVFVTYFEKHLQKNGKKTSCFKSINGRLVL